MNSRLLLFSPYSSVLPGAGVLSAIGDIAPIDRPPGIPICRLHIESSDIRLRRPAKPIIARTDGSYSWDKTWPL